MTTGPLLEVRDVEFRYPGKTENTLHNVSFTVTPGEFIALVGPNGAGKTTLARLLIGIHRPSGGCILMEGQDISGLTVAEISHRIGFLFQNPDHQLFEDTVWEEVVFALKNMGLPQEEIEARANEVLEFCGLQHLRTRAPEGLSVGEKKRAAVASVLAMKTDVLVLDEPTTGQTWSHLEPLMTIIKRLNAAGKTIFMITHDMNLVVDYASRVMVLVGGRLCHDGDVSSLFTNDELIQSSHIELPSVLRLSRALEKSHGFRPCLTTSDLVTQVLGRLQCRT